MDEYGALDRQEQAIREQLTVSRESEFLDWFKDHVTKIGKMRDRIRSEAEDSPEFRALDAYNTFVNEQYEQLSAGEVTRDMKQLRDTMTAFQNDYTTWREIWTAKESFDWEMFPGNELGDMLNSETRFLNKELGTEKQAEPRDRNKDTQETDAVIEQQRQNILQCATLLRNSKTMVNSKEYYDLIDLMEKVGRGRTEPRDGMTRKEQFAQELYAIHEQTEKYLDHKARDGVKKNAYRKLLAVARTNKALESCIEAMGSVSFQTPNGRKDLSELPISLSARQLKTYTEVELKNDYTGRAKALKSRDNSLKGVSSAVISECIQSVDTCMCEIIIKAEEHGNTPAVNALKTMRDSFLEDPFPTVQEDLKMSPKSKGTERGAIH